MLSTQYSCNKGFFLTLLAVAWNKVTSPSFLFMFPKNGCQFLLFMTRPNPLSNFRFSLCSSFQIFHSVFSSLLYWRLQVNLIFCPPIEQKHSIALVEETFLFDKILEYRLQTWQWPVHWVELHIWRIQKPTRHSIHCNSLLQSLFLSPRVYLCLLDCLLCVLRNPCQKWILNQTSTIFLWAFLSVLLLTAFGKVGGKLHHSQEWAS